MNKALVLLFFVVQIVSAQSPEELFNKSLEYADEENYSKVIEICNDFIEKYPKEENVSKIYLNRATAKSRSNDYRGAYDDYTTAYSLDSTYAEAIRQRGYLSKKMKNYDSALKDYQLALKIDSTLAMTYANIAFLHQEKGEISDACKNFELALEKGITGYVGNMLQICDSTSLAYQKFTYKILTDKSYDETYGFTPENPIKVGIGPINQRAYLELLRDVNGNKISYKRKNVGGYYGSDNGIMGLAAVDSYEIEYRDIDGNPTTVMLYLSFYDYEQPKIPYGFFSMDEPK